MKKLLSILGSLGLVATSAATVVACGNSESEAQSIDPAIQEQNFQFLTNWAENTDKSLGDLVTPDQFFFSKGPDGYNKFISDRSQDLTGSFGSTKWSFLDLINDNLGGKSGDKRISLGLARDAKWKVGARFDDVTTYKQLLDKIDYDHSVTNSDKLNNIKISKVTGEYQENGEAPVTGPDAENTTLDAFKKIINLGNIAIADNQEWNNQLNFIEGKDFVNRTYSRTITVENSAVTNSSFDFVQLIKISNVGSLKDNKRLETLIEQLQAKYKEVFGTEDKLFTLNDFMNLAFSKINVFTMSSTPQPYSVSIEIDANDIYGALNNTLHNFDEVVNDYINTKNKEILGNYFKDESADSNVKPQDDSPIVSDNTLKYIDTAINFDDKTPLPRIGGLKKSYTNANGNFVNKIVAYINGQLKTASIKNDSLKIEFKDGGQPSFDDVPDGGIIKKGDSLVISPADIPSNAITGSCTIVAQDDKSLQSNGFDEIAPKLITSAAAAKKTNDSDVKKNDWLAQSLNLDKYDLDSLNKFGMNYWLEPESKFTSLGLESKTLDSKDINDNFKTEIINNLNTTVFKKSLNKQEDDLQLNVVMTDANYSSFMSGKNVWSWTTNKTK